MPILKNNATSTLAASITAIDTQIVLQPGSGELFPNPVGDWFPVTLLKSTGVNEVVRCTSRSGDVLTVERAQEGTQARTFAIGDRAELRFTASCYNELATMVGESGLPPGFGPVPWSLAHEPLGWIFADGRTLLDTTPYQALRSAYIAAGNPHGEDGAGNPKIPDCRGRAIAGIDDATGRLTGGTLGATLGSQSHTLTEAQMPAHGHDGSSSTAGDHAHTASSGAAGAHGHSGSTNSAGSHTHTIPIDTQVLGYGSFKGVNSDSYSQSATSTSGAGAHSHSVSINSVGDHSHSVTVNSAAGHSHTVSVGSTGGGEAHNNVQPTLITNMIIKT